jgi:hypothetical protein
MEPTKPEFWIDDKGYIYPITDTKPWKPIYWIENNYVYPLPGHANTLIVKPKESTSDTQK